MGTSSHEPVCAIVINWNGWRDTVVCLQSLFGITGHPLWVVVCDNGSTDGSRAQLAQWLSTEFGSGGLEITAPESAKAIAFQPPRDGRFANVRCVHLLDLAANHGYAGGINRGIRWGCDRFQARRFWLLNNDVRAEPQALAQLVAARRAVPGAGLCGSVLLDWEAPHAVQAVGGVFSKTLGVAWHRRTTPANPEFPGVCVDVDYPIGASLYVEEDYFQKVGMMEESYFLYGEEMDWVERGRCHGYRPVVALGSRLWHKEGASTGSHGGVRRLSALSERYGVINRLRLTLRFWPAYLPSVWLSLFLVVLDRLFHREFARALLVLRLMFSPHLWLRKHSAGRAPSPGHNPARGR